MKQIDLTTPDGASAGTSTYSIAALVLNLEDPFVAVHLRGQNGELKVIEYRNTDEEAVATAMISGLNTANLSTKSLEHRILERLVADGHLAGAISGDPV